MSWTELAFVPPSLILRLMVTSAIFLPLIKYFNLAPAVTILFVGIRFNSMAPFGYIPQTWNIYFFLLIFIACVHQLIYKRKVLNFNYRQILLLLFVFAVDLVNGKILTIFFLLVLVLCIFYNALKSDKDKYVTSLSFIILSLSLSCYYFLFAQEFATNYISEDELERSYWIDPNYFGIVLGIGVIFSLNWIMNSLNKKNPFFLKTILVSCFILGTVVIILQASRGSLLALVFSFMVLLLYSSIKFKYKIIICLFILLLGLVLYNNGFFDLVLDRIFKDDGSGSGRSEIWSAKLNYLFHNPIYFVGSGFLGSVLSFPPFNADCHNEFISLLLNYGILGLLVLLLELFKLFLYNIPNQDLVRAFVIYTMVSFLTISPLSCETGWTGIPLLLPLLFGFAKK